MKTHVGITAAVAMIGAAGAAQGQSFPNLRYQAGPVELSARLAASVQGAVFDDPAGPSDSPEGDFDASARLNAEWVFANGWVLGGRFEIDTDDRAVEDLQRDEIYGYFVTEYGRLELGEQDGPADVLAFHAPIVGLGQIRGDFVRYAGSQALLSPFDTRDSFKVVYLSPPIFGLRGGVSYAPEFKSNADDPNPRARTIQNDAIELGLQYQRPVGNWIVGVSGSYVTADADPITERADLDSWSVGLQFRRNKLIIAGAYVDRGDSNRLSDFDQWEVNAGVSWRDDRWGAGVSAAIQDTEISENRLVGLGGYFDITRWFTVRADVVYIDEDIGDGVVALGELAVAF